MKTKLNTTIFLLLFFSVFSCDIAFCQSGSYEDYITKDTIRVYYFHYTHRCATCLALEEETRTVLEQVYPEQLASGIIKFGVYNIEKKTTRPIAKKAGVNSQALIIMQKNKRFDLTRDGFLYVLNRPEKLDKKIREVIDNLLYQ